MFEYLKALFKPQQKALQAPHGYTMPAERAGLRLQNPQQSAYSDYLKTYADNAWVYSCIRVLSKKAAAVPFKLYKKMIKNNQVIEVEILTHPILDTLNRPNKFTSRCFFQESIFAYLLLTGNTYILITQVNPSAPLELYTLNPSKIKIVPDEVKFIKEYEYWVGKATTIKYTPEQILHLKLFNSCSEFYGLAPLAAARLAVDSQQSADEYNNQFFANSALPSGALVFPGALTKELRQEIMHSWRSMHGGSSQAHKVALFEGGMDWKNIGVSQKDAEFINSKKLTREDILSVFGVPPIMVGVLEFSNYAVAKAQREIFWRDSVMPLLSAYLDLLNNSFVKIMDETLELKCDWSQIPELQDDKKVVAEIDEIHSRTGIRTINEIRATLGLDIVPWGDTWNAPLGIAPVSASPTPPPPIIAEGKEVKKSSCGDPEIYMPRLEQWRRRSGILEREVQLGQIKEQILSMATKIRDDIHLDCRINQFVKDIEDKKPVAKEVTRYERWLEFKDYTEKAEKDFMVDLRHEFNLQHEEMLNNIEKHGWVKILQRMRFTKAGEFDDKINRLLFNDLQAVKRAKELGDTKLLKILSDNAKRELAKLSVGISFDVTNPRVTKWIDTKAFQFAKEITETTQKQLRQTLKEAIENGESIDDVEKRIGNVFDIATGSRTEVIARTEIISASNEGAMEAYRQSGVVEKKSWLSTQDDRTRETHAVLDGEVVGLNERFSNMLQYPGDPSGPPEEIINCRCTIMSESEIPEE